MAALAEIFNQSQVLQNLLIQSHPMVAILLIPKSGVILMVMDITTAMATVVMAMDTAAMATILKLWRLQQQLMQLVA